MDRHLEGAADGTHARVFQLVEALPSRGKLLDAPCGAGALSARIAPLGFEVHGIDIAPHPEQKLASFRTGDLDRGIPHEDASFDVVISVEGIEHLESPRKFVRELGRVVRPGGYLVISTPNVLNVTSRWRFFTRGFHKHFTPDEKAELSSGHLHAIDYVLLRQFLQAAGLEIVKVSTNQLLRGLRERIFGWFVKRLTRNKHPFARELLSDELLYGQIMIVVARRK